MNDCFLFSTISKGDGNRFQDRYIRIQDQPLNLLRSTIRQQVISMIRKIPNTPTTILYSLSVIRSDSLPLSLGLILSGSIIILNKPHESLSPFYCLQLFIPMKKTVEGGARNQSAQTYYSENSFPVSFGNNPLKNKPYPNLPPQTKLSLSACTPFQTQHQIENMEVPFNRQIIQRIYQQDFPKESIRKKEGNGGPNQISKEVGRKEETEEREENKEGLTQKQGEKEKEERSRERAGYFRTKQEIIRAIYNSKLKYKFRGAAKSSLSSQHLLGDGEIKEEVVKQSKPRLVKIQAKRYSVDNSGKKMKVLGSKTARDKFSPSSKKKEYPKVNLSQVLNSMPKFQRKSENDLNFPKLLEKQRYVQSEEDEEEEEKIASKNPKRQFRNIVQQSLDEGEEGVAKLINTFEPRTASYSQTDKSGFIMKKYKNGVYFGQLSEEIKEGVGIIFYFNGKLYEGEFKNDMKEGKGYELYVDNSYFQGDYVKGYKQGKGRFYWSNGEIYDGEWCKGKKHGSGMWKASATSKKSYIGEWFNGRPHGFGVFFNHVGDRYQGQFKCGLKEGHGTERFINGDVYVGQYVKGRKTGFGEYRYSNGDAYIGQFCNNLKHGKGKFIEEKSHHVYEGSFRNDSISGSGQYLFSDGTVYEGMFENNLIHGEGMVTYRDDTSVEGYWINGVKIDVTSRQKNQKHFTLESEAVRQFASIREKRMKRLSFRETQRDPYRTSKSKSLGKPKSKLKRQIVIEKSPKKSLNVSAQQEYLPRQHSFRHSCCANNHN